MQRPGHTGRKALATKKWQKRPSRRFQKIRFFFWKFTRFFWGAFVIILSFLDPSWAMLERQFVGCEVPWASVGCVRTHWVKAQLFTCRCHCSPPLATLSPPDPLEVSCILFDWKKKKEKGFLRSRGGCCWGARWLCCLFLCFASVVWLDILPRVACHGDEVGDDSWLKWHSTFLSVLRHSWICRRHRIG